MEAEAAAAKEVATTDDRADENLLINVQAAGPGKATEAGVTDLAPMEERIDEQFLINGVQMAISAGLKMIPAVGPFVSMFFGLLWDAVFSGVSAEANRRAMNRLFESIERLIQQQLQELIREDADAYNATAATMGAAYRISVDTFKASRTADNRAVVVARFESLRMHLNLMLNLYSRPTASTVTILSYGLTLSMYVNLLREMIFAGREVGYREQEIAEFKRDIDARLKFSYEHHFYDTFVKLNSDMNNLPWAVQMRNLEVIAVDLCKLIGGLMTFHSEWHSPYEAPALIPEDHPNIEECDLCDWEHSPKVSYVLNLRSLQVFDNNTIFRDPLRYLSQGFLNERPAVMVTLQHPIKVQVARFSSQIGIRVRFRLFALFHQNETGQYTVTVAKDDGHRIPLYQFHTSGIQKVCAFPWFRLYTTSPGNYYFFDNRLEMQYGNVRSPVDSFSMEPGVTYCVIVEPDRNNVSWQTHFVGIEVGPF